MTTTIGQDHLASTEAATDPWRTAVVYQIYPRSFADGNGDGIGDLQALPRVSRTCARLLWMRCG
ncbi:MAG TPA: hypothetical protein VJ820_18250 [Propionibacteriaceae bacterium]|nr:hypothetical protein [Propionibacteriaceae bacterium]